MINLGPAYSLPEPPTLAVLNHVIVYLPEFDLYDDPTASVEAFGTLTGEAYDKPVVRVAATSASLARTPPMKPQDHTAQVKTIVRFAADGTISGQTEETQYRNTRRWPALRRRSAAADWSGDRGPASTSKL